MAIFLPSFLLIVARCRSGIICAGRRAFRRADRHECRRRRHSLAALYSPIWTGAVSRPVDVAAASAALALLVSGRLPPIAVVALTAGNGPKEDWPYVRGARWLW
jgi:chromate transporter